MSKRIIGIMGAMYEEVASLVNLLENITLQERGMRIYYRGQIQGTDVVVVFSRWGKVAAAATAVHLLVEYGITELFFTGMSGAISADLRIGDVVVADKLYRHDIDATPLFARFEIPMLGRTAIPIDPACVLHAQTNLAAMMEQFHTLPGLDKEVLALFGIEEPKVHVGAIASGDVFFKDENQKQALAVVLPDVLCVEMEGASVAQVCYEYKIPFTVVRTISDVASADSEHEFTHFAQKAAGAYSLAIISSLLGLEQQVRTS